MIRDIELDVENSGTIPIVMTAVDPVGTHVVASLARPGGNVTGAVALISELVPKRLQMLKEVLPRASRVGVLGSGPGGFFGESDARLWPDYEAAARSLGLTLIRLDARGIEEIDRALAGIARDRQDALFVAGSPGTVHGAIEDC